MVAWGEVGEPTVAPGRCSIKPCHPTRFWRLRRQNRVGWLLSFRTIYLGFDEHSLKRVFAHPRLHSAAALQLRVSRLVSPTNRNPGCATRPWAPLYNAFGVRIS